MELIVNILSAFLILAGAIFISIASIGVIKFPDFYVRNSASSKAVSLGMGLILVGVIVYYNDLRVLLEIVAIMFFIFLITPLSTYVMARAAFRTKVPFWRRTILKELPENAEISDKGTDHKKDNHAAK